MSENEFVPVFSRVVIVTAISEEALSVSWVELSSGYSLVVHRIELSVVLLRSPVDVDVVRVVLGSAVAVEMSSRYALDVHRSKLSGVLLGPSAWIFIDVVGVAFGSVVVVDVNSAAVVNVNAVVVVFIVVVVVVAKVISRSKIAHTNVFE